MMAESIEAKVAKHGDRMIEIRVRLWTDKIADGGKGSVLPKHAWDAGVVMLQRNESHGISPKAPLPFNGFADLPSKIEEVLLGQGVKVHLSKRQRRYLLAD
jgi:hypothetical protein